MISGTAVAQYLLDILVYRIRRTGQAVGTDKANIEELEVEHLPGQDVDIPSLITELGHKQYANRNLALEKARSLRHRTLRTLIIELRKIADPELNNTADLLEKTLPKLK